MSKIYLASSWKMATVVKELADDLRKRGHEVKTMMSHWRVRKAFEEDKKFINWADTLIMLMPCGRSSHLEAGYAAELGKRVYIIGGFNKGEFETMYGFADEMYYYEETHKMFEDLEQIG